MRHVYVEWTCVVSSACFVDAHMPSLASGAIEHSSSILTVVVGERSIKIRDVAESTLSGGVGCFSSTRGYIIFV